MTDMSLNETLEAFKNLTETLQDCIKSRDIEGAVTLARKRHDTLVDLLENREIEQDAKIAYAKTALIHQQNEHLLVKSSAHQDRSNFIARKSAYRAYTLKAA